MTNILAKLQTTKTINELTDAEVNDLAVLAKDSEEAMWMLKAYFTPAIERLREKKWHHMNNDTHFINDCENRIQHAVKAYNPEFGNFSGRVRRLFNQSVAKYCGERGTQRKVLDLMDGYTANDARNMSGDADNVPSELVVSKFHSNTSISEPKSAEEIVTEKADVAELKAIYCKKETDEIIFDIITKENTYGGLTHYDIARRLADITGKSFHSARSALRTFIKNRKAEVAF